MVEQFIFFNDRWNNVDIKRLKDYYRDDKNINICKLMKKKCKQKCFFFTQTRVKTNEKLNTKVDNYKEQSIPEQATHEEI